ncbi:MAG TPA: LysM domain-containing protein [Mycobacteriales bacterium]|nr:LysM domain-containing protein [Mycobacteriales bacterium]
MSRSRFSLLFGLVCLGLLAVTGPDAATMRQLLSQPRSWATSTPADLAVAEVAALGAWVCLAWTVGGAVLLLAGRLPGLSGRLAAAAAHRVLPSALRRALETALGLTLAVGAVGVPAFSALAQEVAVATASAPASSGGPFDRPVESPPGPPAGPAGGQLAPARPAAGPAAGPATDVVVVVPGDSLWRIATTALGAEATDAAVDRSWRRWHAKNRSVIGANPHLIHPGQRFRPPSAPSLPSLFGTPSTARAHPPEEPP